MDYITGIQNAINYIETHLTDEIEIENVASEAAMSTFYFQRIFGILCGVTLGDYIRLRRLTLAGIELASRKTKIIDIALKYGYETAESFTRAFTKFHGITPSNAKANKDKLKHFSRLSVKITLSGGNTMNYRIEEKQEMLLTGYKQHFTGVPYGEERAKQEEQLFISTRAKQWLLRGAAGASSDGNTEICVIQGFNGNEYDFYYMVELEKYELENMYNRAVTGISCMDSFGFENIVIPKHTYAIFSTEHKAAPVNNYIALREAIANEIIANDDFLISDAPELAVYHWCNKENRNNRYIEIWIPIEKK